MAPWTSAQPVRGNRGLIKSGVGVMGGLDL